MLLISALALGLIETSSAGFNLVSTSRVTATAFAATITATATATVAVPTKAAQHFGGASLRRRGSAGRRKSASDSTGNTVINVVIRDRDKAKKEVETQNKEKTKLNEIKLINITMPSTAINAASVGVGALINSAGNTNVGIGNGGGATIIASSGTLIAETTAGTSAAGGTITWDNNGTLRSLNPGDWSIEQCLLWQQSHHLYFQLGNAFLFLAFLAPHGPLSILWMRALLFIGCILLCMYGYLIECSPDFVLWSGLGSAVNFVYLIGLLCRLRSVQFEKEVEALYISLFKPLNVPRHQFKKVLNCMKVIRGLKYQEVYAQEKVTKVDSLSLVLSGKLVVSQNQRALHIVFPHQFLDSPEWFGVSTDDYFQVSITAMEESRVLIWHRDKLKLSIMSEPFLQTVFDHILGRDVVKKLMQVTQVSESIASNGFLPSGGYAEDAEDKPMLILKKSVDVGHGLSALINRQLQEKHVTLLGRTYYANTSSSLCAVVTLPRRNSSN